MVAMKTVRESKPGPQKGMPRAQQSDTQFPYHNLARSVEVARAISDQGGGVCTRHQLAPMLGYTGVKNGTFLTRISAAKMFGLVEQDGTDLRVTPRGRAIVAPVDESAVANAKLEAFFSVELFRRVYEEYKGTSLPSGAGLQNLFGADYGVVKSRRVPTVGILMASAEEAGLFESRAGRSQMVKPVVSGYQRSQQEVQPQDGGPGHATKAGGGGGNGNGGDQDAGGIDPAIIGLLQRLPPGGTPLGTKEKDRLIAAFTSVVEFIYPDQEDGNDS